MDNVCHTLVGAAFGEAGLKHRTRFGSAALMVAANLPDVDVLAFLTNTTAVSFRRGWTHGVLAQALLPVALTGVLVVLGRRRSRDVDGPPIRAWWLLALSYVGISSHVFLDYLNNYGVRLLAPFDWRWFYGDAVFIVDIWLWVALGSGVWFALRQKSPQAARGALVFAACYAALMLASTRAGRVVVTDLWGELRGATPDALMVGPVPASPFTRTVIVDAGDRYQRGTVTWPATVTFDPVAIPKNDRAPEAAAARDDPRVRAFLGWSRFPYWEIEPGPGGTRVTVRDMRFGDQAGDQLTASTVVQ